jgi:hypothetical protein
MNVSQGATDEPLKPRNPDEEIATNQPKPRDWNNQKRLPTHRRQDEQAHDANRDRCNANELKTTHSVCNLADVRPNGDDTGPERDEDIPRTNEPKNSTFELNPVPVHSNLSCIHLLKNTC